MAMGDMQGIVEDESNYLQDTTALTFIKNNQLTMSALSSNFSNSFDINSFPPYYYSSYARAYDWSGTRGLYDLSMNYKISDPLSMFIQYSNQNNDYEMSYLYHYDFDWIDRTYDVTVIRKGTMQATSAGLSYKALDWLVLGAAYKQYYLTDKFYEDGDFVKESVTGEYSTSYSKQSLASMMLYDIRFFNKDSYLSLRYEGNIFNPSLSKGIDSNGYIVAGAYKIFSGMVTLNAGYSRNYQYTNAWEERTSVGLQVNPAKWITFGLGYVYDDSESKAGYYNTSSIHLGAEYILNESIFLRGGMISKNLPQLNLDPNYSGYDSLAVNYHDYTLGIGYQLSSLSIEFSYLNYQNIPDCADNWSAFTESPEITPYVPILVYAKPSDKRSEVVAIGVNYMF
jgi:hypothetical protein